MQKDKVGTYGKYNLFMLWETLSKSYIVICVELRGPGVARGLLVDMKIGSLCVGKSLTLDGSGCTYVP